MGAPLWTAAAAWGVFFIANAQRIDVVPFFNDLRAAYHVDYAGVGGLLSAYLLGYVLAQIPAGLAADNMPARRVTIAGLACMTATSAAFALTGRYVPALALRFLMGLSGAALYSSTVKLMLGVARNRGAAMGILQSGAGAGMVAGLFLMPLMSGWTGIPAAFLALAAAAAAVLAGGAVWLPAGASPDRRYRRTTHLPRALGLGVPRAVQRVRDHGVATDLSRERVRVQPHGRGRPGRGRQRGAARGVACRGQSLRPHRRADAGDSRGLRRAGRVVRAARRRPQRRRRRRQHGVGRDGARADAAGPDDAHDGVVRHSPGRRRGVAQPRRRPDRVDDLRRALRLRARRDAEFHAGLAPRPRHRTRRIRPRGGIAARRICGARRGHGGHGRVAGDRRLLGDIADRTGGHPDQRRRLDGKDRVRSSRGRVDDIVRQQDSVHKDRQRAAVADGRHTANAEAGRVAARVRAGFLNARGAGEPRDLQKAS